MSANQNDYFPPYNIVPMDLQIEVIAFRRAVELMQAEGYTLCSMIFVKPHPGNPSLCLTAEIPGQQCKDFPGKGLQQIYKHLAEQPPRDIQHFMVPVNPLTDGIKPN